MSLTVNCENALVRQDPSDARIYTFDWQPNFSSGSAAISGSATWTITTISPIGATVMTKDQEAIVVSPTSGIANRGARVRLQGGQDGGRYNIACKITTNESPSQTKEQSFDILVQNR
jgi:hypothetical protein